jgi:hypothetical protein
MSTCDYKSSKNNIAMHYLKFRLNNPHESQLKGNENASSMHYVIRNIIIVKSM